MIIDPQYRKCVTYLFVDLKDKDSGEIKRKPIATTFFVGVPIIEGKIDALYVVTARHVIRGTKPNGPLYIRINLTDETYIDLPNPQDNWTEHPTTDVAICPILVPEKHKIKWLPFSMFENQKFIETNNVMEGDDVFFCGMFQPFPGKEKMQPIIRFGNISMMPYEKIYLRDDPDDPPYLAEAYLVEARSWGGHSGSPTFLYFKPDRNPGQIIITTTSGGPYSILLGLVSSHYCIPGDVKFTGDVLGSGEVDINAGIAAIIPARYISELLLRDEFVEQRKEFAQKINENIQSQKIDVSSMNPKELTKKELEEVLRSISHPKKKIV